MDPCQDQTCTEVEKIYQHGVMPAGESLSVTHSPTSSFHPPFQMEANQLPRWGNKVPNYTQHSYIC